MGRIQAGDCNRITKIIRNTVNEKPVKSMVSQAFINIRKIKNAEDGT